MHKVMMTEAYTSLENTTKYYNYGSHVPFNFNFIMNINANSNAHDFQLTISEWMQKMPNVPYSVANWVVRKRYFNVNLLSRQSAMIDI